MSIAEDILQQASQIRDNYYRLVLVALPSGGGKTGALQDVARRTGWRYVNVNLELSRRLLELTERQRALRLTSLLEDAVGPIGDDPVLLDNLELLFDRNLRQDPLRLLQSLGRRRIVIAAWGGQVVGGYLTYAEPDHADYRRYPASELVVIGPEQAKKVI